MIDVRRDLEIFVVNFLLTEYSQRCVDSIRATSPAGVRITVIDNSPEKWLFTGIDDYWHFPFNPSLTRVWNWAIAACKTPWVALVDHDAVFKPGWVDAFQNEDHMRQAKLHNWSYAQFIHRSIIKSVGWFDERFTTFYYEDADFMRRVNLAGEPMCVKHPPSCDLNWKIDHMRPPDDHPVFFQYSSVTAGVRGDVFYEAKWGDRINDPWAHGVPLWDNPNWYPTVKLPKWPYANPAHP